VVFRIVFSSIYFGVYWLIYLVSSLVLPLLGFVGGFVCMWAVWGCFVLFWGLLGGCFCFLDAWVSVLGGVFVCVFVLGVAVYGCLCDF